MRAKFSVVLIIIALLFVSLTNTYALACPMPYEQNDVEAMTNVHINTNDEHSASDCHSSQMNQIEPLKQSKEENHCEGMCFCVQSMHSPNSFFANFITWSLEHLSFKRISYFLTFTHSIDITPPTPPPISIVL